MTDPHADSPGAGSAMPPAPAPRRTPRWLLPVLLIVGALLLLNLGLYFRLSQPPATPSAAPGGAAEGAPTAAPPATATNPPAPAAVAINTPVVTGTAPVQYTAAFVDGASPSAWLPFAGDWRTLNGELVQQDTTGFDRGIVYTAQPFGSYTLSTRLRLLAGAGAGVIFNLPQVNQKNGGHLVRYTDDGAGLFWGYFDDSGVFTGQGFAGVGAPGADVHELVVRVGDESYAIQLDGRSLAEGQPLRSRSGYAGLVTNQAAAAFSAFSASGSGAVQSGVASLPTAPIGATATPTQAIAPAAPVSPTLVMTVTPTTAAPLDLEAISGEWQQQDDAIYQLKTAATDFSLSTGIAGERYRLAVAITMTDTEDLGNMGAGVLFHMPDRTDNKGAQLVRFVNAGRGLAWGSFDESGAFRGEGYVDLNLTPDAPHLLTLTVDGDRFAVMVDDRPIVQDIPTVRDNGWLALTTFRGPVEFKNMQLQLGSIVP